MYQQWKPIEVRERVVQLYLSDLSFSEIGKRSGVSKQTAFNIANIAATRDFTNDN